MAPIPIRLFLSFAALCCAPLAGQSPAAGRDWFVRAGAVAGDGSHAAPFDDPWRALARCEAGDRIHVTGGQYFGRVGRGTWAIPNERVELIGGYAEDFSQRDPWRNPTQLCWNSKSKNWPLYARLTSDQRDVVVDGIVIDMQDQNAYETEQHLGRTGRLGESAMQFSQPATVRNCVVLNPGNYAIDCRIGATIENNVVVNAVVWGIVVAGARSGLERTVATIRGNTVVRTWDPDKPGAGGYGGSAIALRAPANVVDNVLAHSDNAAIYAVVDPATLGLHGNVFWKSGFANLTSESGAQRAVVKDADLEMLEDVGLADYADNVVGAPTFPLDVKVFESGFAPAVSLSMALGMLLPADAPARAGAHLRTLPRPEFAAAPPPSVAKTYERVELPSWNRAAAKVDGRSFEMVVAVGGVTNISMMPGDYPKDGIAGVQLYDPEGAGEWVTGYFLKGTTADRVCSEATGWYRGTGKPDRLHVVRGIARAVAGVSRGAFFVETIERHDPPAPVVAAPKGRDWFVRAGASGGDGSREKPFRDPFQALERCEAGDSIHVAQGEYNGKLKAGRWSIGMPYVALLGGYDATFTTRDPWSQPSRLNCAADFQGRRVGYTLEGTDDHTGVVVDGFVFDKRGDNVYDKNGSMDVGHSDKIEHLWLSRPGCVVRNCVFLNGASGAVRLASGQTVRNCLFVNHVLETVKVEAGHTRTPFEFHDNTALFCWANHVGEGHGASGSLLRLGGSTTAVVTGNLLAYADNDGMRIECDPVDVQLGDNVFSHNLWSNVQQMGSGDTIDDVTMAQLADLGLRRCERNRTGEPGLPIDPEWLAKHQSVRGPAEVGGAPPPPAKAPTTRNPFDDDAGAGSPVPPSPSTASTGNPFGEARKESAETTAGETFAPAYDLQAALSLVSERAEVGARRRKLEVAFTGVQREVERHDYATTTWQVALRGEDWERLTGTRVQLEGAIKSTDRSYQLADIGEADYACYLFSSPDGSGLPLRCYVRRGTAVERVCNQAAGFATGKPVELHVLRGIARERRQLVVESAEKSH